MLERGKNVGGYTLIQYLDSGGFGDVWKAEKRTAFSVTEFALKFFRPKSEGEVDFEKIRKEVGFSQKLSGLPYIISVIEADKFEDYIYIVSEFADGGSLGKYLKNNGGKAPTQQEAIDFTQQILNGLEQMHKQGIVHRDLKPDNVLIKKGVCCLADFGISREMKSHSRGSAGTAGTWEFMPPEAFEKQPSITLHTDIWAVGVILQKLLTGNVPFPQDNIASLMAAILMQNPEEMPSEIPSGLREVVRKALQKDRQNRFQTAEEMREALRDSLTKRHETFWVEPILVTIDEDEFECQQDIMRHQRERFEAEERERERFAAEEKERREQLEKERAEENRLKLLPHLKALNERAVEFGIFLSEADLDAEKLAAFEKEVVENETRKAQSAEKMRQIQDALEQRIRALETKSIQFNIQKPNQANLTEFIVEDFEKRIAEAERRQVKSRPLPVAEQTGFVKSAPKTVVKPKVKSVVTTRNLLLGAIIGLIILLPLGTWLAYSLRGFFKNDSAITQTNNPVIPANVETIKNSFGMELVKIPNGSFVMGSPASEERRDEDESPQRNVAINYDFYLGKYEVTISEWKAVTGNLPDGLQNTKFDESEKQPVVLVSWNDAQEFIKKLNALNDGYEYRLPSEAEWEYAARAGTTTVFAFGNNLSSEEANFHGDYPYGKARRGKWLEKTAPVGSYQPNAFGLYDMHGNVWEWVQDVYADSYAGLSPDGSANANLKSVELRVMRGGTWLLDGFLCRSASRERNAPNLRVNYVGFRIAARQK